MLVKKNKIRLILLLLHFLITSLNGQSSSQIKKAKKYIQKTGLSDEQVRKIGKSKGASESQIDAVLDKGDTGSKVNVVKSPEFEESNSNTDVRSASKLEISDEVANNTNNSSSNKEIQQDENLELESKNDNTSRVLRFFGYDIFQRDPEIFQTANVGAINPDYLIGPGDEIIAMLWGETEFRQVLKVDREGFIFIPEIGQVFVNGLSLTLLESKLFRVFSQAYESLRSQGRGATTFLDVSIGKLRPLRVQVLGEVSQPGAYTINPSATLFSSLYYFKGPTTQGSLRDIRLIRGEKVIGSIDFYDFLLTGKKPKDEKLQLDDVIFIPKRMKTVTINGEINRPGIYEIRQGETLADLLKISGGLKATAYLGRAQIDRIVPFEDRNDLGLDRMIIDINLEKLLNEKDKFELQDRDEIKIFEIMDSRQNIVFLNGAIARPGTYELTASMTIRDLIIKADSLSGDAYMDKVDIERIRGDNTKELIKLDLSKIMSSDPNDNIILKNLDRVSVYSTSRLIPEDFVSIIGHVKEPGIYPLREKMSLYDLVFQAGGFLDSDFKNLTYLDRAEIIRNNPSKNNKMIIPFNLGEVLSKTDGSSVVLMSGDEVKIYSKEEIKGPENYVSIQGHVKYPGDYELIKENMTLFDILFQAGGFEDEQFLAKTFTERADLIRLDREHINKSIIPFNLKNILSDPDHIENVKLEAGDQIVVYAHGVFNTVKYVNIKGVVRNPGQYDLRSKMNVKDLILAAGGLSEDVYRYKIEIFRIDPKILSDDIYAETISIDMDNTYSIEKIYFNNKSQEVYHNYPSFELKPYDYVVVRSDPYFKMQRRVQILGAVYYPGDYVLLGPSDDLFSIIKRAGGLRPEAYPSASTFSREGQNIKLSVKKVVKNRKSKDNILMRNGDIIKIAFKPGMVFLSGGISSPGSYKFYKNKRVSYYLSIGGGLTPNADRDHIWITFPDGKSKRWKRWTSNPTVLDGSVINIGLKEKEEPVDKTEFAKEIASIMADFAQIFGLFIITQSNN